MCKTCSKIVEKNYRVEKLGRSHQACFACADEHGVKLTRMDDEEASVRSRNDSTTSSRTHGDNSTVVSPTAPSVVSGLGKNGRSTSEPLYRHQEYHEMQQQRQHADLVRFHSHPDVVPQRARVDSHIDARGSPVSSHKSEPAYYHHTEQQTPREQQSQQPPPSHSHSQTARNKYYSNSRRRTPHRDPFIDGRPPKAASDRGYSHFKDDANGAASASATTSIRDTRIPKRGEEPPVVAALDLSYLSSYK